MNIGNVSIENLKGVYMTNFFIPFGVVLFAFLGFTAMPEITRHLNGQEKMIKKALVLGMFIPFIVTERL